MGLKYFMVQIDNFKDVYKLLKSLKISKKLTLQTIATSIMFSKNKYNGQKVKNIGKNFKKNYKRIRQSIKK